MTFCVTLAASLAARQGSTSMAAFQVCLQVWLATSLLADGLAVAGQVRIADMYVISSWTNLFVESHSFFELHWSSTFQAILASAFANQDYSKATAAATRVLQVL